MKKIKMVCMLIVSIMIGASALSSVNAAVIDEGSIDVTINDGLWGTVSPVINIPDETSVTLKVNKINETTYEVDDELSIPLNINCDKSNVLIPKWFITLIQARRGIADKKVQHSEVVSIYNGTIWYDGIVPEMITANASYTISEETFTNGEKMKLDVFAVGLLPGSGSPNEFEIELEDVLNLLPEEDLLFGGFLIRLIKEFIKFGFTIDLSSFPIFAGKIVDLNINYVLEGEPPVGYSLDLEVAEGNGSVVASPSQTVYDEGTEVTLTATGNAGYIFSKWSGDISGTENPVNVTMDENKTIYAHFVKEPVLVTPVIALPMILPNMAFGIKFNIVNQEEHALSDITWNITSSSDGLLPFLGSSASTNGTIESIASNEAATIEGPAVKLFGKTDIVVTLDIPGIGLVQQEYNGVKNLFSILVIYP